MKKLAALFLASSCLLTPPAKAVEADCFMVSPTLGTTIPCAGDALGGAVGITSISNPVATLTRPANTTAYVTGNLIASNTVAGSVVVASFTTQNSGAGIARIRLKTNVTTGWDTATIRVRLWTVAPTYTNGDGGAYAATTGTALLLAQYDVTLNQFADSAQGYGISATGVAYIKLVSGSTIFWDMQYTGTPAVTPISGQVFTLSPEVVN